MNMTVLRICAILMTFLFLIGCYTLVVVIRHRRDTINIVFTITSVILSYIAVQAFYIALNPSGDDRMYSYQVCDFVRALPPYVSLIVSGSFAVLYGFMIYDILKYNRTHINLLSVKSGLDALTDGLMFYRADGSVQMINHTMNDIASKIIGGPVVNGLNFTNILKGDDPDISCTYIKSGEHPIIELSDGCVYSFESTVREYRGTSVNELIAVNVTEEYALSAQLSKQNVELTDRRRKLTDLNASITNMTIESEILNSKIQIHDELGRLLSATRHYIEQNAGDIDQILNSWNINVSLLSGTPVKMEPARNGYETVLKAAGDVGVSVHVDGNLPDEARAQKIISTAIRECVTNTFRHAHGDELYVRITEEAGDYRIRLTNNGEPPASEVTETGGLKDLRTLVENSGGTMETVSAPEFVLTICIGRDAVDLFE
ncbi:MAG: hypothetical protein IJS12_06185 [Lachnospiraceae bacterium]|nr:hypothetical protein [Lachnospiraceae bacterium]